jgi:chemotaxis-related protein WspD
MARSSPPRPGTADAPSAIARLLDRPSTDSYVAEATQHFAQPKRTDERRTESVTIFRLGAEWLALPTSAVLEVTEMRPVHSLPHRRGALLGLTNVRGELLPCLSLAQLLGVPAVTEPAGAAARGGRLLVARHTDLRVVFPVDTVHGIHRFHPSEAKPAPATVAKALSAHTRAVLGWNEHAVGWLDETRVFHAVERNLA